MSASTVTTSMSVEQVQATAEEMAVAGGGKITAATPWLTTAVFRKEFSWIWFILMLGIFYLMYWLTKRDQMLAVSHCASEGSTIVTIAATGPSAERVRNGILHMLARHEPASMPPVSSAAESPSPAEDEAAEL